jgi:hypothetical protein
MDHFGRTHVLRLVKFIASPLEDTQLFVVTHPLEISFVQTAVWSGWEIFAHDIFVHDTFVHDNDCPW